MIRSEKTNGAWDAVHEKEMLPKEIKGLDVFYCYAGSGKSVIFPAENRRQIVLLLLEGSGSVGYSGNVREFDGLSVYLADPQSTFELAARTDTQYLKILYNLAECEHPAAHEPYFQPYSLCSTYREAIKSNRTVNRTLLPEGLTPRFCMGSVQTSGPDRVGEHAHPMLEQFFFGLPGNDCVVTADGLCAPFGENILLHIPSGSTHGVVVEEGRELHYIWMDLFKENDMSYIRKNHIEKAEQEVNAWKP